MGAILRDDLGSIVPRESVDRPDNTSGCVINGAGYGLAIPSPGLPHRTGPGIGLEVHEWPYLVKGDTTVLRPGMTFSNEPTICICAEFGVRLEDHVVITETGARCLTQPAPRPMILRHRE